MSELHKFLFEGLPVRGMLVQLTDTWQEILRRREQAGAFPPAVRAVLGEMTAAAALMQSNIKFNGALVLQIAGDGPVKLMVAEVQPDLTLRATAKVTGEVADQAPLRDMVNVLGQGRCAITLDPKDRQPGQQPYQGVVPLQSADGRSLERLSQVIEQYMRQSEQLETTLVLAANDERAAGLLIQRLPLEGENNLAGQGVDTADLAEAYNRISHLAASLQPDELLGLDAATILRRLFWEESVRVFEPLHPRFACNCSRERVGQMLRNLGREEVDGIVAEQGRVEIACDFCGAHYHFDAVDVGSLFTPDVHSGEGSSRLQ